MDSQSYKAHSSRPIVIQYPSLPSFVCSTLEVDEIMADKILAVSLFTQWSDKAVTMGRDVVDAAVAFIEEAAKTPAESPKTKEGGQVDEGTGVDADEEVDGDAEVDEDCEVDDTEEDSEVNMEDGYVIDDEDADGVIKGAEDPKVPTDGEPQVA